jgi:hypothetical protein
LASEEALIMRAFAILGVLTLAIPAAAQALTVSVAKIDKGAIQIKGKGTAALAPLTWEGQGVAQAQKSGAFRFATTILPQDCIGELSDGTTTVPVVIADCGPVAGGV